MFYDAVEVAVLGAGLMGTCIAGKLIIKSYGARLLFVGYCLSII